MTQIPDKAVQATYEPLELTYTNYRGETSQRRITPKAVYFGSTEWHPEPQWLLTAYDHDKQADRDFALKDFGTPYLTASVEVKELKWTRYEDSDESEAWEANTPFSGCYVIKRVLSGYTLATPDDDEDHDTLEAAKAAAQADYRKHKLDGLIFKPVDVAAVRRQAFEEAKCRLIDLAVKAREAAKRSHAKQHDEKYGARKKQRFYEEKKHFNRLAVGYSKSATAIRALSPAEPVDQWQGIATAPRDGTPILVHDGGLYAYVAEFNKSIKSWIGADNRCWEPTHWMPLPATPTSKGGE